MKTFSDIYDNYFAGSQESFQEVTRELLILQVFEDAFNHFISNKIANYNKGGRIFLSRFNARNIRQDAFHIHFCPVKEDNLSFIQCNIATGFILDKKVIFEKISFLPQYVYWDYYNILADIFRDFGFTIERK